MPDLANLAIVITQTGAAEVLQRLDTLSSLVLGLGAKIDTLALKNTTVSQTFTKVDSSAKTAASGLNTFASSTQNLANKTTAALAPMSNLQRQMLGLSPILAKVARDAQVFGTAFDKLSASTANLANKTTAALAPMSNLQRQLLGLSPITQAAHRDSQVFGTALNNLGNSAKNAGVGTTAALAPMSNLQRQMLGLSPITQQAAFQYHKFGTEQYVVKDAIDKTSTAVQRNNDYLNRHNQTWIQHIATVAGGIIVYQGIRSAMGLTLKFFSEGTKAVSDYEDALIGMSAIYTTLAKDQSNIPETYKLNYEYAQKLVPVLEEIDKRTTLNLNDLIQMSQAWAKNGVAIDVTNNKQKQGMTNIANALVIATKGQATGRQIIQEIDALMSGKIRPQMDKLADLVNRTMGGSLKDSLKTWQAHGQAIGDTGYVIEMLGQKLVGFTEASKMTEGTWTAVSESLKTSFNIVARESLTGILKEWVGYLQQFNTYLRENKEQIGAVIKEGWEKVKTVSKAIHENFDKIVLAAELFYGAKAIGKVIAFGKELKVIKDVLTGVKVVSETLVGLNIVNTVFGSAKIALAVGGIATLVAELSGLATILGTGGAIAIGAAAITTIGVAVTGVIGAVYLLYTNWSKVVDIIKTSGITKYYTTLGSIIANTAGIVGDLWTKFMSLEATQTVIRGVSTTFETIGNTIKTVLVWALERVNIFLGRIDTAIKTIRASIGTTPASVLNNNTSTQEQDFPSNKPRTLSEQVAYNNYGKPSIVTTNKPQPLIGRVDKDKAKTDAQLRAEENRIERLLDRIDAFIAKENDASKAWKNYTDGLELIKDAMKEGRVGSDQYSEVLRVASERTGDAFKKPFDAIINEMNRVEDPFEKFSITFKRISDTKTDDLAVLYKALSDEMDAGGYKSKTYTEILKNQKLVTEEAEQAAQATTKALERELATRGYSVKVTKANREEVIKAVNENIAYNEYLKTSYTDVALAAGLSTDVVSALTRAMGEFAKKGAIANSTFENVGIGLSAIGSAFGIQGLDSIGAGIKGLGVTTDAKNNPLTPEQLQQQQIGSYAAIANGIGSLVGGKTGGVISSAASGAMTGAMIGPYGAAIGGAVGLITGILDNSAYKEARAARDKTRGGIYENMVQSALSGGTESLKILQTAGFSYGGVANYQDTYAGRGSTRGYNDRLLEDRNEETLAQLSSILNALDAAGKSIAAFAKPSIITTIESINAQYSYAVSQAGNLAELETARIDSLIVALTGLSVDNLTTMFESIVTSVAPEEAGKAMADKVMEGLISSVRQMQIASFEQSVVAPMLQPLYAAIVGDIQTGSSTTGSIAAIKAALDKLTPVMTEFSKSLGIEGLLGTTESITNLTGSLLSLASAGANLEEYRLTLFKNTTDSFVGLQVQKDIISKLAVQALSSDYNTRLTAINGLPSNVGSALDLAREYYADPMELNREYARQSNLLSTVASKQESVTLADLKTSVDALNRSLVEVIGTGNTTSDDIKTILREFQDIGITIAT